jgi:uncharacterized protein (DUF111 family)
MRTLYLDCIGGIAGDMMLAALIEVGVPESALRDALQSLNLSGWEWHSERVEVEAVQARRVQIRVVEEQPHRHLSDVLAIIERRTLVGAGAPERLPRVPETGGSGGNRA